jgi:hypothetical protein
MSPIIKLVVVAFAAAPLMVLAAEGGSDNPKPNCINGVVYSKAFLERFPEAGGACREVKVEHGKKWIRFNAEVKRVKGHEVTADFIDKYEHAVATLTFRASKDARLMVDGKSTTYSHLVKGDKLEVWMPEDRVGFYAAPRAMKDERLSLVSHETPKRR